MPHTIMVERPGTMSHSDEYPNEERWTFTVNVNGRGGIVSAYFPAGTGEDAAASITLEDLRKNPQQHLSPLPSELAGGGGPGSSGPSAPASGSESGPVVHIRDLDDDDDPPKMKTEDGT